jgi:solute carrier family 32 (vesicular inhibitory amino acid transporter)
MFGKLKYYFYSLIPTVFLPLSLLSYASILGIMSTLLIIVVIFIDGFSIQHRPGSLWDPADTAWGFDGATHLGIAFGLFIAGVSRELFVLSRPLV